MAFQKVVGPLTISETGGVASVSLQMGSAIGGGSVAGFVSANVSAQAQVSAVLLMDAGLGLLEAKFPAFATEIALIKSALDAEIAKI